MTTSSIRPPAERRRIAQSLRDAVGTLVWMAITAAARRMEALFNQPREPEVILVPDTFRTASEIYPKVLWNLANRGKEPDWPTPHQESPDLPTKKLVLLGTATIVVFTIAVVITYLVMRAEERRINRLGPSVPEAIGRPVIQGVRQMLFEQDVEGRLLNDGKQKRLQSYGWVDREKGIAHIPIDEAMDLYLRERRSQPAGMP